MKHNTTTRTKSNMKKLLVVILALSSTSFQPVYASGDDLNGSSVPPIFFGFNQFQPDSLSPTAAPSISLSAEPSLSPTKSTSSTRSPPLVASVDPTVAPSKVLSSVPSDQPSVTASNTPTEVHSSIPSTQPPVTASNSLTEVHSAMPSAQPSVTASNTPTEGPTFMPSAQPSVTSSNIPTEVHSSMPSAQPSVTVSNIPTEGQTSMPSARPSVTASNSPTEVHSSAPSTVAVDPKPYQANNGELPENGEQKPGNKGTSPFVYVMVSGIIAFGGVMFIRYRRRQRLLSDREIVMGSPSRGHLNELYYDNDLI